METKFIFSARVRSLRKQRNISQKMLAEKLKIKQSSEYMYENEKGFPNVENLINIAEYFEVSIDYLLGRTDNPQSHKT